MLVCGVVASLLFFIVSFFTEQLATYVTSSIINNLFPGVIKYHTALLLSKVFCETCNNGVFNLQL